MSQPLPSVRSKSWPPQRSEAWLDARRGKITASIAAACLGLDPNKSRQEAWREITGREKQPVNFHMRRGIDNEPRGRKAYEKLTASKVDECGFWLHDLYPWLGCSPDGLVNVGDGQEDTIVEGLVEIKCPELVKASVPVVHRIQMLIQLECTGFPWCDYFCWAKWQEPFLTRVKASPGAKGLVRRLFVFWWQYVMQDVEPPRKVRKAVQRLPAADQRALASAKAWGWK